MDRRDCADGRTGRGRAKEAQPFIIWWRQILPMNLLNLAPDIQEAILFMTGEGPAEQSLRETSVRTLSAEVIWSRQREQWKKWSAPLGDWRKKRVGAARTANSFLAGDRSAATLR